MLIILILTMIGLTAAGAQLIVSEAHLPQYTGIAAFLQTDIHSSSGFCFLY